MLSSLEKSILAALVYFDIFEYPLTLLEIHRFLLNFPSPFQGEGRVRVGEGAITVGEVRSALLESDKLKSVIRFKNGFFYLRGQEHKIRTRSQRLIISLPKYRRAKYVSRLLSWAPFVRLIAVCNSLAYGNARQESDIDLFIVTKKGGVWWARFISVAILKLLRLRVGQAGIKNKICLSFFVDSEHLNLEAIKLGETDVYLPIWLATLYPLYDAGNYYQRLWQANNWVAKYLPGRTPVLPHPLRSRVFPPVVRLAVEALLLPFSFAAAALQRRVFPAEIKRLLNKDTRVLAGPGVLKFHTNDRRAEYSQEFQKRIDALSSGLV